MNGKGNDYTLLVGLDWADETHDLACLSEVGGKRSHLRIGDSVYCGLKATGSDSRNCLYIGPGTNTASYPGNVHPRMSAHNEGINLSFCDGHVQWYRAQNVHRGTFWRRK